MRKFLLGLALVGVLSAPPAFAQSVVQDDLSGNESWSAGQGPGGPSGFVTSNLVRNSTAIVATTISAAVTVGVSTGLTSLIEGGNLIITAQPLAAVITLPPNPFTNGGIVGFCNPTSAAFATNVVTLAANTGQTLSTATALTTLAANTCAYVQFNRSNTTWYRIQ